MSPVDFRKWDIRFLELAKHISSWSKDPSTQVGAVIVNRRHVVVGMGYNGFPRGVKDLNERLINREVKYSMIVHAEVNAILNANAKVAGCTLYVWPTIMIPAVCPECCKAVIQSGIKEVVCYYTDNPSPRWQELATISGAMLHESGIRMRAIRTEGV